MFPAATVTFYISVSNTAGIQFPTPLLFLTIIIITITHGILEIGMPLLNSVVGFSTVLTIRCRNTLLDGTLVLSNSSREYREEINIQSKTIVSKMWPLDPPGLVV